MKKNRKSTEATKSRVQKHASNNWHKRLVYLLAKSHQFEEQDNNEAITAIGSIYLDFAPKKLYRYRPASYGKCNNNLDLAAIKDEKIWFSRPKNFNDPFDCQFDYDIKSIASSLLRKDADLMRLYSDSIEDKMTIEEAINESVETNKTDFYKQIALLKQNVAVACFCEKNDSILMWGHYADCHKGICIEYNLHDFPKELSFTPMPVLYSKKTAIFRGDISDDIIHEFYIKSLLTKSLDWAYEKEWRIVRNKAACGEDWKEKGALLKSVKPTAFYLGCEAEDRIINDMKKIAKDLNCPLYQMKKAEWEYRLVSEIIE